jgi:hypothetical protein
LIEIPISNPCLREVGYEILKDQLVTAEHARQIPDLPAGFLEAGRGK